MTQLDEKVPEASQFTLVVETRHPEPHDGV